MPARIVVVHDEPHFREFVVTALLEAGYDTKAFTGSMAAIEALEAAQRIELLITRVRFPEGTPHGVSLASMALTKKRGCASCSLRARRTENIPVGSANFCPCR